MIGQVLLISGPSGSGKSSLLNKLFSEFKNTYFSISSTTRAPRDGEKNGVNYHFISKDEFEADIKAGHFLEWANVHGNFYGTSLKPVIKALNENKIVIFDIDVQGFILARKQDFALTSVFVTTKDKSTLENRLKNRGTENNESIKERLKNATGEMEYLKEYDYIIINEDLEKAYDELRSVFISMQNKSSNIDIGTLKAKWQN